MRRISSQGTFFYKRISPFLFFGFAFIFAALSLFNASRSGNTSGLGNLILPIVVVGLGIYYMRKYSFDLADEVYDDGNALVVRNNGQEQRIDLADITNVNYTAGSRGTPPRVTLSLRRPTIFGDHVTFCAPSGFLGSSTSSLANDLIARVDQARQSRR
jgi:hypothetical protein